MKVVFYHLCAFTLYSNAIYISHPSSNTTLLSQLNGTLGALPGMPDTDFSYLAGYHQPSLPYTACIMAAVTAMRELALLDLDDHVSSKSQWTHPDYLGATVSVAGSDEGTVTVRFSLWLIHAGLRDMLYRQRYEVAKFAGTFRGRQVGYALFEAYRPRNVEEGQAAKILRQSSISLSNSLITASLALEGNDNLQADVEYLPKDVDSKDIFAMSVYLLMSLASQKIDEPMVAYHISFDAITARIRTIWNGVKSPAAHPRQHILTAGDMVNMIAYLPEICIHDNRFREMNIVIKEDEAVIGRGAIRMQAFSLLH